MTASDGDSGATIRGRRSRSYALSADDRDRTLGERRSKEEKKRFRRPDEYIIMIRVHLLILLFTIETTLLTIIITIHPTPRRS